MLLVAGGAGIVPLMAMVRARRAAGSRVPFRLIHSVRTYIFTRSSPKGLRGHRVGSKLATSRALINPRVPNRAAPCGPTGFVELVADILVTLGHDPRRIKTERFGPSGG